MARSAKKTMGKDAVVSILTKYLHPSRYIREKFPNATSNHRLNGLVVLRMEHKLVSRKQQLTIVVRSEKFKDDEGRFIELHAVPRWFKVEQEGPDMYFFEKQGEHEGQAKEPQPNPMPEGLAERIGTIGILNDEDLHNLAGSGITVDDDNQPLEENIPTNEPTNRDVFAAEWGHDGICYRRQAGGQNVRASLSDFPKNFIPTPVQLFEHLFPKKYLQEVLIRQTNKALPPNEPHLTYGELLRFIGLWFEMATCHFENRRGFWSTKSVERHTGAPFRFNVDMSRSRFETILASLALTDEDAPTFYDPFWEVRQIQREWNENMFDHFSPSWISVLDESMSKWLSEYTCPGFMCVPRKPWPLGNEWHSICCAQSGVMYAVELVEGKDHPPQLGNPEFNEKGKTVGLLQRLTRRLWHTSKAVVLDSGFCVLQGLVELRKKGVFAAALIKKRKYWPKHIRGDDIAKHFQEKDVGDTDAWAGELEGTRFHVFCMKEPDYVMSIMSTYGTLVRTGTGKSRQYAKAGEKRRKTFQYPEVISDYFACRDKVDSHNGLRMFPIALEETWKTKRWPLRVFQFLLAITEVNIKLVAEYCFRCDKTSQQEFRRSFAKEMIYNIYYEQERNKKGKRSSPRALNFAHDLVPLGPYKTFDGTSLVKCKTRYIQLKCSRCTSRIRTFCTCSPGVMLCQRCFQLHLLEK